MNHTVLIVEDEKGICETLTIFLESQGYQVLQAYNGLEGLQLLENNEVHLAIVDIMMPIMDGITMVSHLRKKSDIPVIFLSAKSEDIDKITGLNLGADDYVTKPFEPMELMARVNSNIRRYDQILNLKTKQNENRLICGDLELDRYTKEVFVSNKPVRLTYKEFAILELLMRYPGRVYSADEIYEAVWNEEAINTDTIMVHIRKLREKIEVNPKKPQYLKVVWGIGYKIEKRGE